MRWHCAGTRWAVCLSNLDLVCLKDTLFILAVIAQQMLLFPYRSVNPVAIPFRVTHLILASTRSVVTPNAGLKISPPPLARTREERRAISRKVLSSLVDPAWIEANNERFEMLFKRATHPSM